MKGYIYKKPDSSPSLRFAGLARLDAERAARMDREAAARYQELAKRRGEDEERYLTMAKEALASARNWEARP